MFILKDLPFDKNSLEPYISASTLDYHHGKHHQTYVNNLNKLIEGTDLANLSLEEIILQSHGSSDQVGIFNNAAQVYNHDFFWQSLSSQVEDREIDEKILELITKYFVSLDNFYSEFSSLASSQFGSGWVWLVKNEADELSLLKTANADTPIVHGLIPLATIDVWEHAYYLDYQNKRQDFVETCLKELFNWNFVTKNYFK